MKKLITLLLFLFASLQAIAAPQLSFSVDKHHVAPGEQVNLEFTALTQQYFVDSPNFSMPYIANAMVKRERTSVLSGYTYVDGKKYTSQRWSIQVYPNSKGVYLIPAMSVTLFTVGDDLQTVKTSIKTKPVAIMVKAPAGMEKRDGYLVSPKVGVEDSWNLDKAAAHYKKGDIIQRKISITAEDTSGFMMPDFNPIVPEGVSVSMLEPSISSEYARGNHSATLTQTINYSIDKPGQFSLGQEELTWWNPQQQRAENWKADAIKIDAGGIDYSRLSKWLLGSITGLLCVWLLRLVWLRYQPSFTRLEQMLTSDGASWLNACYQKISIKTRGARLADASQNKTGVEEALEREFNTTKRVNIWRRLRVYFSL